MLAYERLLRYAQFPTASEPDNPNCPSSEAQLVFARALVEEMHDLGIDDARVDEHGYVYGTIPNIPNWQGYHCFCPYGCRRMYRKMCRHGW